LLEGLNLIPSIFRSEFYLEVLPSQKLECATEKEFGDSQNKDSILNKQAKPE
jgi:hypothetical protein